MTVSASSSDSSWPDFDLLVLDRRLQHAQRGSALRVARLHRLGEIGADLFGQFTHLRSLLGAFYSRRPCRSTSPRSSARPARCSAATSASRPDCTARTTCSARCCSSIRATRRRSARRSRRRSARCGRAKIVAPALGGVIIGYTVAEALDLPSIFTERKEGAMTLRRGFRIGDGERGRDRRGRRDDRQVDARDGGRSSSSIGGRRRRLRVDSQSQREGESVRRAVRVADVARARDVRRSACPLCATGVPLDAPGSRYSQSWRRSRRGETRRSRARRCEVPRGRD